MADHDWYRREVWSAEVEREFLDRLRRSRSQRDQYLAIQAITLVRLRPDITLRLADLYFDTRTAAFDDSRVLAARGAAHEELGNVGEAVTAYCAALEREDEVPGFKTNAHLAYPYLVATRQIATNYVHALEVLDRHHDQVAFPAGRFRWNAARALILAAQGETDLAREFAEHALAAAAETNSEFRYHRHLGLVGHGHETIIDKLCELVTATP